MKKIISFPFIIITIVMIFHSCEKNEIIDNLEYKYFIEYHEDSHRVTTQQELVFFVLKAIDNPTAKLESCSFQNLTDSKTSFHSNPLILFLKRLLQNMN